MPKVIPLIRKPKPEPLFYFHPCASADFRLRDDGEIICAKCDKVIRWIDGIGWADNGRN